MIKKASLKKLLQKTAVQLAEPLLTKQGFQLVSSKNQYYKRTGVFKLCIDFLHQAAHLDYDPMTKTYNLTFRIDVYVGIPEYDKWLKEVVPGLGVFKHHTRKAFYTMEIEESQLAELEFFVPNQAQRFKGRFSSISVISKRPNSTAYQELLVQNYQPIIAELEQLAGFEQLYEQRPQPFNPKYLYLLIFGQHTEKAKSVFTAYAASKLKYWQENLPDDKAGQKSKIDQYNTFANDINQRLQLDIAQWEVQFSKYELKRAESVLPIGPDLVLRELFRIENPWYSIIGFARINNFIYQIQGNGQIYKHSITGEELCEINLPIGEKRKKALEFRAIPQKGLLFVDQFILDNEDQVHELPFRLDKSFRKEYYQPPYGQAYFPKTGRYAFFISDLKKHEAHFFDAAFQPIEVIPLEHWPMEFIPESGLILTNIDERSYEVYNLKGRHLRSMPSKNASYNNLKGFDFSVKADLFISFWFYAKSQSFRLSDGQALSTLWAHQTYLKGYKDALYNDIHHNFGMTHARISPADSYIVGGAEHGKYVAWRLPDFERVELIPQTDYLKGWPKAEIVEWQGHTFLKNRGNRVRHIEFFDQGKYFGLLIHEDLLIWDENFNHLHTLEGIKSVKAIDSNTFLIERENASIIYELGKRKNRLI